MRREIFNTYKKIRENQNLIGILFYYFIQIIPRNLRNCSESSSLQTHVVHKLLIYCFQGQSHCSLTMVNILFIIFKHTNTTTLNILIYPKCLVSDHHRYQNTYLLFTFFSPQKSYYVSCFTLSWTLTKIRLQTNQPVYDLELNMAEHQLRYCMHCHKYGAIISSLYQVVPKRRLVSGQTQNFFTSSVESCSIFETPLSLLVSLNLTKSGILNNKKKLCSRPF